MRDLPPGATGVVGDPSVAMGQTGDDTSAEGHFADDGEDFGEGHHASQTSATDSSSGSVATAIDMPPPSSGNISWTGMSAPESEPVPAPSVPAPTPPISAPVVAADEPQAPTTKAPTTQAPTMQAPTTPTATTEDPSGEKKVVWSSSPPDRYSTFGGSGSRRDDY